MIEYVFVKSFFSETGIGREIMSLPFISEVVYIGLIAIPNKIIILFEDELSVSQEESLNLLIQNHTGVMPIPVIFSHCKKSEKRKDAVDVDYVKHMISTLYKDVVMKKDGFVERTTYYLGYGVNGYINPVIKVDAFYTVVNDSTIQSAKTIGSKSKVWSVYLDDNTWSIPHDELYGWYKEKERPYTGSERSNKLTEGFKRRKNVESELSIELTYLFIQMGVVTGNSFDELIMESENVLISFLGNFSKSIQLWYKTGRGSEKLSLPNIYREVEEVSIVLFPWLDNIISPELSIGLSAVVEVSENTTIRNYIVKRLKSELV